MKSIHLKLSVVSIVFLAYSFSMSAQERKEPDFDKMFKRLDANKDGSISLEEFKSAKRKKEVPVERLEKNFAHLDADENGMVTREELEEGWKKAKNKKKNKQG
ncbi:EF-hand domain-containing protein [Algibacter mikhailovii]|uniref:EF-hand domain-containing protein n=1 Tax=Algibacter mikhailovii TaxID=425498 RepID=UPI00249453A8|nr:EF-hand domain-containing protein [Algibacter mikhailovii]